MSIEEQKGAREGVFGFDSHPEDPAIVLRFFLDFMLYQPSSANSASSEQGSPVYFGLSQTAVNNVTNMGKVSWSHQSLTTAKVRAR